MSEAGIQSWSYTPIANATVNTISIAELCPAANINNAIRQVMSSVMQEIAYQGTDISASVSMSLAGVDWRFMAVTGSASIIHVGTGRAGLVRNVIWHSPSTLVGSANIITDGGGNIITATNDMTMFTSLGSGAWRAVTFPAAGSVIPDGSITTAKLANGAVTFGKMQAITDGHLLGASGGTAIEEISIGAGLTLASNILSLSSGAGVYNYISGCEMNVFTNTTLTIKAGQVTDASGVGIVCAAKTLNMATTGENALDAGSFAASTRYAVYEIMKADLTQAVLASLSFTAPTLPSGYLYFKRIFWIESDASVHLIPMAQVDRQFRRVTLTTPVSGAASGNPGLYTLDLPTGKQWPVVLSVGLTSSVNGKIFLTCYQPGMTNPGASVGVSQLYNNLATSGTSATGTVSLITDTSSRFAAVPDNTCTVTASVAIWTDNGLWG